MTTLDDDVPGFTISITDGDTTVSEAGTTDTFGVMLDRQPLSSVVLIVTSSDPGEATADVTTLTFTAADWNQVQTVTVTGVPDGIADGTGSTEIVVSMDASRSDDAFDSVADQIVAVSVQDFQMWQSNTHPCDVNADGFIQPVDLLLVINDVNTRGSRQLPALPVPGEGPPPYVDVSGDGIVGPVDILHVITYLNVHGAGPVPGPEGEANSGSSGGRVSPEGEGAISAGLGSAGTIGSNTAGLTPAGPADCDPGYRQRAKSRERLMRRDSWSLDGRLLRGSDNWGYEAVLDLIAADVQRAWASR